MRSARDGGSLKLKGQSLIKIGEGTKELPFRLFVKGVIKALATSIRTEANWDAVDRPYCLVGVSSGEQDEPLLRKRVSKRTTLVIGNVKDTVPRFVRQNQQILLFPGKRMLRRVAPYFDDTHLFCNHSFAGELFAIDEFSRDNNRVKIDQWPGIAYSRPFPESF